MNHSHYPSLELCKKLTEIGFPETELGIFDTRKSWKSYNCPYIYQYEEQKFVPFWNIEIGDGEIEITNFKNKPNEGYNQSSPLVYPSVMEMLDVMPQIIYKHYEEDDDYYKCTLRIYPKEIVSYFQFECSEDYMSFPVLHNNSLADALAEMVLWLVDNNYISFTK